MGSPDWRASVPHTDLAMLTRSCVLTLLLGLAGASRQCENTFPDGTPCGQNDFVQQEDPELCYKYYKCDSGCVTHETCPGDFKYDTLYAFCIHFFTFEFLDRVVMENERSLEHHVAKKKI